MVFFEGCYLLSLDGTGFFSSKKLSSDICLKKVNKKTGEVTYHLQMLGAAIVHPDFKEVISLAPEFINKQDGETKNDCERNAAKRFFEKLRNDSNEPIVNTCRSYSVLYQQTCHYSQCLNKGYLGIKFNSALYCSSSKKSRHSSHFCHGP